MNNESLQVVCLQENVSLHRRLRLYPTAGPVTANTQCVRSASGCLCNISTEREGYLGKIYAHEFEEVKDYEVVRPVRLHTVRKRHTENLRPETIRYAVTVGGRDIEMQLEKNNELLTKDYTETYYKEDGTEVTTSPKDIDHCYYHGSIVNDSESSVSISTCDGLRGYFRTSAQRYLIEPLSGGDEGDHAVMTFNDENFKPAGSSFVQQQKYIELFLVADNREAYKPLRTFIALVGLEIWTGSDQISVTPPAGANLDAFMKWRNSNLVKRKKHDNAHLISGIDFEGATVGLAFIGTLCSGHSVGVVQVTMVPLVIWLIVMFATKEFDVSQSDHNDRAIAVGATLAHEMGHNLGMDHDDSSVCACSGDSCIMAAALSWNVPRTFSSCSSNNYERYLTSRSPSCLLDKPDYNSVVAPPVCGNGFVEKGELCDCGTVEECTNPCCNATTCTLREGARCGEGECCEDCKILPRSRECRRKQDDCDLAEYCDGERTTCPEDVFAVNGLPCDGGLGYCYNGQCPQRPDQCVKLYGSSAIEARAYCYNQNERGTYYAFCKRPANDRFIACQQEDVLCGKLFCHNGQDNPNYGRMVRFGDCKAAFFDDYTKDYGQVDAGTKCGDGKVCNHKSECQCEPGWMPPFCNSKDRTSAALSPGAISAIVATVLLVVSGVIAGPEASSSTKGLTVPPTGESGETVPNERLMRGTERFVMTVSSAACFTAGL
ncbi:Disintegrin and metalloproteinase domain-containing protein 28 [Collichthys lucidus]|uniref:Disintegrin and metalloproteinase domain-containing protein 28 n=1 Tax=Collichthys lucidus TaxID=240159 RepID=A0A4U5USI3_COLLU|nr:Disintegrin and metalloproteinase domain-containing protein 28 [Collichthys lucidus]